MLAFAGYSEHRWVASIAATVNHVNTYPLPSIFMQKPFVALISFCGYAIMLKVSVVLYRTWIAKNNMDSEAKAQ